MKFVTFFVITFVFFFSSLSPEIITKEIINLEINKSNFNEVKKSLENNCSSDNFFLNLQNHPSYPKFGTAKSWKKVCKKIFNSNISLSFIKRYFKILSFPKRGVLTGYYEPLIRISLKKDKKFRFPILKKSKHLEVERKKIIQIYKNKDVLYWTDDKINLFFLQIQGSGIGELKNGKKVMIKYQGHNNHKYTSIGKILVTNGYIDKNEVSMFYIKNWLSNNPLVSDKIMNQNKRYIFFKKAPFTPTSSIGAMGKVLIAGTSIAIDNKLFPYGIPFVLNTDDKKFNKIVISHDTGSAIKGYNRADLFIGRGKEAEIMAGNLKKSLQLISLVPYIDN